MHGASDDCQDESEYQICADYLRRRHFRIIEQKNGPRAPAPAEENPDSTPIGKASHGSQRAFFRANLGFCIRGTNVTLDDAASNRPSKMTTHGLPSWPAKECSAYIPSTRPGTPP